MPSWSDDEGRCHYTVEGVPCYRSEAGCPMHGIETRAKASRKKITKKKTEVQLVSLDDGWVGIYINGKLVHQNHDLSVRVFMHHLQSIGLAKDIDFKDGEPESEEADQRIQDMGELPENFADIAKDIVS